MCARAIERRDVRARRDNRSSPHERRSSAPRHARERALADVDGIGAIAERDPHRRERILVHLRARAQLCCAWRKISKAAQKAQSVFSLVSSRSAGHLGVRSIQHRALHQDRPPRRRADRAAQRDARHNHHSKQSSSHRLSNLLATKLRGGNLLNPGVCPLTGEIHSFDPRRTGPVCAAWQNPEAPSNMPMRKR